MITLALMAILHGSTLAFSHAAPTPVPGIVAVGSCTDPWGTSAGVAGMVRDVHPDVLRERFAPSIAQRDWATALAGYVSVIDTTLRNLSNSPSAEFARLRGEFVSAAKMFTERILPALRGPPAARPAALDSLGMNMFRPVNNLRNQLAILQGESRPFGEVIDSTKLATDELKAICWSGWSLYRLLHNVNFETIPAALARIEAQERRWERYRNNGPMQLPHELLLNRIRRAAFPPKGSHRFNPPVFDFVAMHPFAGIELVRTEGAVARTESLAAEVGGVTWWIQDWRRPLGVSWVLAYDADGRIGRGPLLRAGGFATAGWLRRRDVDGATRQSLLVTVDALRILKPDAAPQALRQLQSVAGEILDNPLR